MAKTYQNVDVEFGVNTILPIKIDSIIDQFLSLIFGTLEKDGNCDITKIIPMPIESLDELIPDKEGRLKRDDKNKKPKQSGGLRNILEVYIRFLYKLIGMPIEQFLKLLQPLSFLSGGFFKNMKLDGSNIYGNNLQIPDIAWIIKQISMPGSMSLGLKNMTKFVQEIGIKIKSIITDVLRPIIKLLSDMKGFITDLLIKPLGKLNLPIPSIPLGFIDIKLPSFDMNDLFGDSSISLDKFNMPNIPDLDINGLMMKPFDTIMGFLNKCDIDVSNDLIDNLKDALDINFISEFPEIDLSEFEWIDDINKGPVEQFEYIMKIDDYKNSEGISYLPYFYRENGFEIDGDFKWYYSFDFFKNFELEDVKETIDNEYYEIHGLWKSITDAQLDKEEGFISDVYSLFSRYNWGNTNKLPEEAERIMKDKYPIKDNNGLIKTERPRTFDEWISAERIDRFYDFLEKTFEYNFWNSVKYKIDSNGDYIKQNQSWRKNNNGRLLTYRGRYNYLSDNKYYKDSDDIGSPSKNQNNDKLGYTRFNYKKLKMDFFKLIYTKYKNKIQFFTSHQRLDYVLDNTEYTENIDNLTVNFSEILRFSNDRESDGKLIEGILNNNPFRVSIGLKPISTHDPLDEFRDSGFLNFKPANFTKLISLVKDIPCVPTIVPWIFSVVDLIREMIMFPINILLEFVMKLVKIIKDVLILNIPGAIDKIGEFVGMLMPSLDFFRNISMNILSPLIKPMFLKQKEKLDKTNKDLAKKMVNNKKFNLNVNLPNINLPKIDIGKLQLEFPDAPIELLRVMINLPNIDIEKLQFEFPDVSLGLLQRISNFKFPSIPNIPTPNLPKIDLGKLQVEFPDVPLELLQKIGRLQLPMCSLLTILDKFEVIGMIALPKLHMKTLMELFCLVLETVTSTLPIPIPLGGVCPVNLNIDASAEEFNILRDAGKGFSFSPKAPQNYQWLIRQQYIDDEI